MSQQNDDFISFEKALRELQMQSEELKKLVSEGEIRAFRDNDSMKFRREDLEALQRGQGGEEELVFAELLEDDAGMATEELSEDDTLLADDEGDELMAATPAPAGAGRPAARSRIAAAAEEEEKEPAWVAAIAVVSFVLLIYGFIVAHKVAQETPPDNLTSMWAPK